MKYLVEKHWHSLNRYKQTMVITNSSFVFNLLAGILKLGLGLYLYSAWFIVNSIYYLVICVARGHSLKQLYVVDKIKNEQVRANREIKVYQKSGLLLCLIGISYFFVCLQMYFSGNSGMYNRMEAVLVIATISFVKIGFAIYGVISTRQLDSPIIALLKMISFVDACVSIVVTQYALLTVMRSAYAAESSAALGIMMSCLFVLLGIWMFIKNKYVSQKGKF